MKIYWQYSVKQWLTLSHYHTNERRQEVDLCTKKIYVVCYVKSQTQQAATSLGSACRKANLWRQLGAVNTARRCDRRRLPSTLFACLAQSRDKLQFSKMYYVIVARWQSYSLTGFWFDPGEFLVSTQHTPPLSNDEVGKKCFFFFAFKAGSTLSRLSLYFCIVELFLRSPIEQFCSGAHDT